ncbi:MAG: tetratricopeptide repeat protein [Bacteroidales bacterium]|nr:tetratricopeptide repeat protein [Bacteroidales bacterium]
MKKYFILLISVCALMGAACHQKGNSPVGPKQNAQCAEVLQQYHHADSLYKIGFIDSASFNRFIRSAIKLADENPQSDMAPEMLYKAGVGSMILAKSSITREETAHYAKQALKIFYDFQEKFPDHENAKYCYYQRGIVYDDILGDYTSAQDQYRDFINRYPDDSLAVQLKDYLKILGKDERQLEEMLDLK